jgi:hypothetical protein
VSTPATCTAVSTVGSASTVESRVCMKSSYPPPFCTTTSASETASWVRTLAS